MIKMKNPKISVVMPVFNSEKFLIEAIQSILSQTYQNFEFIIVDDASTDKSLSISEEYAKKDNRIKVIKNKFNKGIAISRNIGIRNSKGKYIATQDSDDISNPERLIKQFMFLDKNPDVGVVGSHIRIFGDNGESYRFYNQNDKDLRNKIFFYSPIAQPASMIRKKVFKDVGYYDEKYPPCEDLDLWFRIGNKYKFANIQEILINYRERNESATYKKTKMMEKLSLEIRLKNKKNKSYNFGIIELLFNMLHLISIYIIPSKLKINLFKIIRDNY